MWNRLKSALGGKLAPSEPERPPAGREEFLRFIQQHGVLLLATDIRDDGIDLVVHQREGGQKVNPLFSTSVSAARWIQTLSLKQVTAFPSLRLQASWLVESFPESEPIVFDVGTPWERELTRDDIRLLAHYLKEAGQQ